MSAIWKPMARWWGQPDHFSWFSSYLHARHLAGMTRGVLIAVTLALACVPIGTLFSSVPPRGTVATTLAVAAGMGGAGAALIWILRFPTRNQSIAYALTCSASIALAASSQSDPLTALLACTAFATLSGYIALFHTAPLMTANVAIILAVSLLPAIALSLRDGLVRAACVYTVMLVVNVAVPYAIQIIVLALGVDVLRADRDALTGLYARRAFHERAASLVATSPPGAHLVVVMIDLDRFKRLNDTRGHVEGDRVLVAVGRALRDHTRPTAVLGRVGGEEFLVADAFTDSRPNSLGQHLCDAVAALPHRVTASVGTATTRCGELPQDADPTSLLSAMIDDADMAMYDAKRHGGNQVRHHRR